MIHTKKGFTLLEVLTVVVIIVLMVAWALPQYMRSVERSRLMEAVTLLDNVAKAQQRKYMQLNKFMLTYKGLDVAFPGASGSVFYTKGDPVTGENCNGFAMELHNGPSYETGYVDAIRYNSGQDLRSHYTLRRLYGNPETSCMSDEPSGQALCADFCGIEDPVPACCSDGMSRACVPES